MGNIIQPEEVIEKYMVQGVEVTITEREKELEYYVKEPQTSDKETKIVKTYVDNIYSREHPLKGMDKSSVDNEVAKLPEPIQYHIRKMMSCYGKIYPITLDPNILEIYIIEVDRPIYVRHGHFPKHPYIKTNLKFKDIKEMDDIIERIKIKIAANSSINAHEGLVDRNFYAQIIIQKEPYNSICFLKRRTEITATNLWLVEEKMLTMQEMVYLWTIIEIKVTIALTGAGREERRRFLNGLIEMIPLKSKIMAIERMPFSKTSHEFFLKVNISGKSGLDYRRALEIARRYGVEYVVMDGDEIQEKIELPTEEICFIYSRQTPLETTAGMGVRLILPNNQLAESIEYVEKVDERETPIKINGYDTPKQLYDKSKVLQSWAKLNNVNKEKVIESLALKINLMMYLSRKDR